MRLVRHHLGAVYRLEFSMVELGLLSGEPPIAHDKPVSQILKELAAIAEHLESAVAQKSLHYQDDLLDGEYSCRRQ